jgi:hypothetical protein
MLSIEEIKLTIDTLKKLKGENFQEFIHQYLKKLEKLAQTVDAYNQTEINKLDKTKNWYQQDLDWRASIKQHGEFDTLLFERVKNKIEQFAKTGGQAELFNSLEIGPGYGTYSKCFLAWRLNFFLDLLVTCESKIKKQFNPKHHKYLRFYTTHRTDCGPMPDNSVNFVFSWDTFPFFTQDHIDEYLRDIKRVILPGGYCFIHYADCFYDKDLKEAKRGYWNYNTKSDMTKIIEKNGYNIIEMEQFRSGANYAIFQKPGNQNPVLYRVLEAPLPYEEK